MRVQRGILGGGLLLVLLAGTVTRAEEIALENRSVRRVLAEQDGVWRTVQFARADGTDRLAVESDEFLIRLMDGTEQTAADYRSVGRPEERVAEGVRTLTIRYAPRTAGGGGVANVEVEYRLADEPYLRKSIRLTFAGDAPNAAVDRLEIERFRTDTPGARGGRGEPVFLGAAWFAGLEYPGSETGIEKRQVTLAHFPGSARRAAAGDAAVVQGKTAVVGTGVKGDPLELAFGDYLQTIRRPSRVMLHYNSWYDLREAEITPATILAAYDAFRTNVLEPYGVQMTTMVPDDGWQEPQSIWAPRAAQFPDGFRPLREALEAHGTRLGLWMPFNGFNLDVPWGAEQGYEKSNQGRYYCLVGPKYNAALRSAIERLIRDGHLNYFKHDFNQLQCSAEGHGHLADARHGHEANLDAELDLLAFERRLQPDIFLNVTSCVWHSPWWLMHADTIWMDAEDYAYDTTWPQLSPREWDMSYRDVHFYKVYAEQQRLVPLSAMMTHGIIHGRYQKHGGPDETLREWSDQVVMYYGRGVQLMEWYITPTMMTPDRWEVLGRATKWAITNRAVLEQSVFVGGDPRQGRPYGYAHWQGDRGLLVLRNPDLAAREIVVPFDKSVRYRGETGRPFRGRVIYPFVQDLAVPFSSGTPIRLPIPGCTVLVCELEPGEARSADKVEEPSALRAAAKLTPNAAGAEMLRVVVPVPDEDMPRCEVVLVAHTRQHGEVMFPVTLNGEAVTTRVGRGDDWVMQSVDVRSRRGRPAEVEFVLNPGKDATPFDRPAVTVDAWVVADRAVEAGGPPTADLLPIAPRHRRQTLAVMQGTACRREEHRRRLTEAELSTVTSAKLRLCGFDVNGEEPYANKFVYLNGEKVGRVPANRGALSAWQEHVIDLPVEQLKRLQLRNEVEIDNLVGDYFKVSGLALAVQLPDGSWVQTRPDERVHCSVADWAYAEGEPFKENRSGVIVLAFE